MKKYRRKIKPCTEMLSSGEIEKIHSNRFGLWLESASCDP